MNKPTAFGLHKPFRTRIYAVGGAATNIVSAFEANANKDNITNLDISYIDSSTANLHPGISSDNVFIFTNGNTQLNGGGKDRAATIPQVKPQIPQILKAHPPLDFSVVVHSASGASGSTAGPCLTEELLAKGHPVLVLQIGSTGSRKEIDNTIGTIKDYSRISARQNKPVVAFYREVNRKNNQGMVDRQILSVMYMVSVLFSDKNPGMDKSDLAHLLDYPKVTKFKPELSGIEFFHDSAEDHGQDHLVPQAIAKLVNNKAGDNVEIKIPRVEYVADAIMGDESAARLDGCNALIAMVYTGDYRLILNRLVEEQALFKQEEASRDAASMSVIVGDDDDEGVM